MAAERFHAFTSWAAARGQLSITWPFETETTYMRKDEVTDVLTQDEVLMNAVSKGVSVTSEQAKADIAHIAVNKVDFVRKVFYVSVL